MADTGMSFPQAERDASMQMTSNDLEGFCGNATDHASQEPLASTLLSTRCLKLRQGRNEREVVKLSGRQDKALPPIEVDLAV
jgi:hypothetical protein